MFEALSEKPAGLNSSIAIYFFAHLPAALQAPGVLHLLQGLKLAPFWQGRFSS
jgi:hypothetical protein